MKDSSLRNEIYSYMLLYISRCGYSPTYEEIQTDLDISSKSVIKYHIDKLRDAGYLEVVGGMSRGVISIIDVETGNKICASAELIKYDVHAQNTHARKCNIGLPVVIRRSVKAKYVKVPAVMYFGGCAYCGSNRDPIEMDHFLPIDLGGADAPGNIVPACRKCNRLKSNSEPVSWVLSNFSVDVLIKIISYINSEYRGK